MKESIDAALSELVGLPLRGTSRAADLQVFSFGALISKKGRSQTTLVGSLGLHLQCPWRLTDVTLGRILTGSGDVYIPAEAREDTDEDFVWDLAGANRCDAVLGDLFVHLKEGKGPRVQAVAADEFGGFSLSLTDGRVIEVFPDNGFGSDAGETWRLVKFGESHFVVSAAGVEWG